MRKASIKKQKNRPHDAVYRRIFSNPRIIEDVLRRFVTGPWLVKLDFSTLEQVPAHYVSPFLEQRESDVVWRICYGPEKSDWFYIYVLMELQSTVDRFMALRMAEYVMLFWRSLVKQGALTDSDLLPPVLPIVLYNGEEPWWAKTSLAKLAQSVEGLPMPHFEYVVVDVNHYPADELRPVTDVASGVFLMEQAASFKELRAAAEEVGPLIRDPHLEEDVSLLVSSVLGKLARKGEEISPLRTLRENSMSLLERAETWPQQWLAEGEERGEKRGLRQGEAKLLKSLANQRFGELPTWAVERFDRADVDTLDRWSHRLLDADRLEDVFDDLE